MNNRPQTLYGIVDSPVGLAAWMLDHDIRSYEMIARVFDGKTEGLTRDDVLDNVTLYWLTNTAISSARLYWDNAHIADGRLLRRAGHQDPGRRERLPRRDLPGSAELGGEGLSQAHPLQQAPQGRPFAAWEQPKLLRLRDARSVQVAAQLERTDGGWRARILARSTPYRRIATPTICVGRQGADRSGAQGTSCQSNGAVPLAIRRLALGFRRCTGSGFAACATARRRRPKSRPFQVQRSAKRRSSISAGASPPRDGPTRKPSPISRRAHSWPNCRSWCATGAAATTGARRKRS